MKNVDATYYAQFLIITHESFESIIARIKIPYGTKYTEVILVTIIEIGGR